MSIDFLNNKNILVTGATGLIGSNLVDILMASKASQIFVIGRNLIKIQKTFQEYHNDPRLIMIEHDISNQLPNKINNIDYIFHAAGPMERDIISNKPMDVIFPNIIGTLNLLNKLKEQYQQMGKSGRLIIFSSVTVYNNYSDTDITVNESNTEYAEKIDSSSCYSESKRMIEVIAKSYYKQYNTNVVIARFSTVYGYTRNIPNTAFYEFIKKAIKRENIILNGTNFPKRDNIYIDDAIEGLLLIASKGISGESYNISSNGEKNNFSAIDEIASIINQQTSQILKKSPVKIETKHFTNRKAGILLSNSKLQKLGWTLKWDIKNGINETITKILKMNNL